MKKVIIIIVIILILIVGAFIFLSPKNKQEKTENTAVEIEAEIEEEHSDIDPDVDLDLESIPLDLNDEEKAEFNENLELEVTLPPPAFLSMSQGTQLVTAATQYADAIVEVEMAGESDEAKQLFKKRLIRKLIPSYLSDEEMQDIKDNVILDKSTGSSSQLEDETGG